MKKLSKWNVEWLWRHRAQGAHYEFACRRDEKEKGNFSENCFVSFGSRCCDERKRKKNRALIKLDPRKLYLSFARPLWCCLTQHSISATIWVQVHGDVKKSAAVVTKAPVGHMLKDCKNTHRWMRKLQLDSAKSLCLYFFPFKLWKWVWWLK